MANRLFAAVTASILGWVGIATAHAEPLQVMYAEPFRAQSIQTPGAQKNGAHLLRVQALGRTFDLTLEENSRLLRQAPPQTRSRLSNTQLLKGAIRNVPDSWVRLTLTNGVYSGAIWDGIELYGVEPREVLDPVLVTPLQGAAGGSAIYRLSDTQGGALQGVCGLDTATTGTRSTPLARYRQLVGDIQAAAATAPREIEVSMVADFEFTSRQGAATVATMVNHVNVVDGIFSEQVGVSIVPTDFITFATDADPFTTSDSGTLLEQFADYRASIPAVRSRGLAHLLTGRELNGNIIGIAFLGSLCVEREGVSLSESSPFIDTPLIMAHELGHNFGAPHDNEPGSACASTPPTFVMAPELNNSGTFSQCSLQQMQPVIAGAACVVPARTRDVAVAVPATTLTVAPDQTFEFIADVAATGDAAAVNVVVNVDLPGGLQRLSLSSPGLACAFTPTGVSCAEPELAAGETRRLSVQLRASAESQFTVAAHVSSSNDSNATNNHAQTDITVAIPRDLTIAVAPQPITVVKGEPFQMTFDIASIASRTLNNVQVEITHYGGITATAATIEGGTCTTTGTLDQPMAVCTLPSLAPGVSRRLQATMVSGSIGTINTPASIRAFEAGNPTGQRFTEFFVATQAAHDLAISTTSPIGQRVVIGSDAVWTLDVRSRGVRAVDDVTVTLQWIGSTTAFEFAVDPPVAQSCTPLPPWQIICSFGTMQPGESRTLTLRAHDSGPADVRIDTMVRSTQSDDNFNDNTQSLGIQSMVADDLQMHILFGTSNAFEGREETLMAAVTADGVNASENVVVTATLPAGFVVQAAVIDQDTCPLKPASPNVVSCAVAYIQPGGRSIMSVRYTAGAPGVYTGTFSATATNDATPGNNSGTVTLDVAANVDGALVGPPQQILRTDIPVELPFTLTTNKYTLPDARVDFNWSQVEDVVVSAPGASCAATSTGHTCLFGTLAPNSAIPFTVRLRAAAPPWAFLTVRLSSPAETDPGNNNVFLTLQVYPPGDAAIVIPQPVPAATLGQRTEIAYDFNVAADVYNVFLEFDFDPSRLTSVFAGGVCSDTATGLRCDLGTQQPQQSSHFTLSYIPNVVGTTPITVRVVSINDANPANDAQTATITIVAPAPPPPPPPPASSGGSGGGGGPMSLPLLLALALLALREQLFRRNARVRFPQR